MEMTMQVPEAERLDPHVISPAEASELLAGHSWSSFVVLGDSVAEGVGDPSEGYATVTWGDRVAAALARVWAGLTYANLGQRYLKAAEIRDYQLAPALELAPDLAAVVGGGNDLLVEDFEVAPVGQALDEVVGTLVGTGADVVTFEMMDLPGAFGGTGFEELDRRLRLLNEAVREIAAERGTIHVDLHSPPWARERECFSADLQHGSMRGQAIAASATIRALGDHLRRNGG
jgi:lysophospholipase L1-like esterase